METLKGSPTLNLQIKTQLIQQWPWTIHFSEADKLKFYRSGQTNQVSAQATDHLEAVVRVVFVEADVDTEVVADSEQFEGHGSADEVFSHPTEFLDPEQIHKKMDRKKKQQKDGPKKNCADKKKLLKKMLQREYAPHL